LNMALEEAKARRDSKRFRENLITLAVAGRDAELKSILRVKDPETLRQERLRFAEKLQRNANGCALPRSYSAMPRSQQ